MSLKQQLESIKMQCQRGGVSIDPNHSNRLLGELTDCCLALDERLQTLEGVRGAVALDEAEQRGRNEVEQRPRVDNDVTRGKGKQRT
jgi:hypothetical protein